MKYTHYNKRQHNGTMVRLIAAVVVTVSLVSIALGGISSAVTISGQNGQITYGTCPVSGPLMSPLGSLDAGSTNAPATEQTAGNIYTSNLDGSDAILLIEDACFPIISSDGQRLIYTPIENGWVSTGSPWIANIDGSERQQLDVSAFSGGALPVSLVGNTAYVTGSVDGESGLHAVNIFTGDITNVLLGSQFDGNISQWAVSPDGTRVAVSELTSISGGGLQHVLWVYDADTGGAVGQFDDIDIAASNFIWSSAGDRLLFDYYDSDVGSEVLEWIDVNTGEGTVVVGGPTRSAQFSPDGTLIIYQQGQAVYTVNPDGSNVQHAFDLGDFSTSGSFQLVWNMYLDSDDDITTNPPVSGGSEDVLDEDGFTPGAPNTGRSLGFNPSLAVVLVLLSGASLVAVVSVLKYTTRLEQR